MEGGSASLRQGNLVAQGPLTIALAAALSCSTAAGP